MTDQSERTQLVEAIATYFRENGLKRLSDPHNTPDDRRDDVAHYDSEQAGEWEEPLKDVADFYGIDESDFDIVTEAADAVLAELGSNT